MYAGRATAGSPWLGHAHRGDSIASYPLGRAARSAHTSRIDARARSRVAAPDAGCGKNCGPCDRQNQRYPASSLPCAGIINASASPPHKRATT